MTKTKTIVQQADDAFAAGDADALSALLAEPNATVPERTYVLDRMVQREEERQADSMTVRIDTARRIGMGLNLTAAARYRRGDVLDKEGNPVVISSDKLSELGLAECRQALGGKEADDRFQLSESRSIGKTDFQRFWQAAKLSERDIVTGLATVDPKKSEQLSAVIAAAHTAMLDSGRTAAERQAAEEKRTAAKEAAEQRKAEAKREADATKAADPDKAPYPVPEEWTLEQLRDEAAAIMVRIGIVKAAAAKEAAAKAAAEEADRLTAERFGMTVEQLRETLAKAAAKEEAPAA